VTKEAREALVAARADLVAEAPAGMSADPADANGSQRKRKPGKKDGKGRKGKA
jgi:hypothetical protein